MALIKMSSLGITNLSGKAGGSVYAHNRGGSYVRNFAVPSNPQTTAQSATRAAFGAFASQWRMLTEPQRKEWIDATSDFPYIDRFGSERVMSGENLFISLNRNIELVGGDLITAPPVPQGVDGVISMSPTLELVSTALNISSLGISATLADNGEATTGYLVYLTSAFSAGKSYFKNRLRFMASLDETQIAAATDSSLVSAFTNTFGIPPEGGKIGVKVVPINTLTGERGAEIIDTLIVTTAE